MKIGIITFYYNNFNYGGELQAYALVKLLNKMGYDAEQISYDRRTNRSAKDVIIDMIGRDKFRKIKVKMMQGNLKKNISTDEIIMGNISKRNCCMKKFESSIPHSKKVYRAENIHTSNKVYDVFITGSDQVWNFEWFCPAYFLDFVQANKKKISYAASMPQTNLPGEREKYLKEVLNDFSGVSVRETVTRDYLKELLNKDVVQVLDPTLMLDKAEWEKVCPSRRIEEKYVFCYFLGAGMEKRKLAEEYAQKYGYKLVTLPYLLPDHRDDENFGDYRLYDVAPDGFLSLVKNAEFIFTDSFHAAVFSNIFEKEFCVIDRNKEQGYMLSRIHTLLDMLGENDRLISQDNCSLEVMSRFKKINYKNVKERICREQEKSKKFLFDKLS